MEYGLQVLLVLALMGVGFFARKQKILSATGTSELARILVSIIYPCLIFSSITRLHFQSFAQNWAMPLLALGLAGTGFFMGWLVLRMIKGVNPHRADAFLFQSTINNYLFLPLPLVMLLWGNEGVALLVFASVGFELTVWSVGIFLFNRSNGFREGLYRMFSPPLLTLLGSIAWVCLRDSGWIPALPPGDLAERLFQLFHFGTQSLGNGTIAISMLVAGSRIAAMDFRAMYDPHVWLLIPLRLLVVPVIYILLLRQLPLSSTAYGILCVIATMPAAIASLVFSERFGGDSDFISSSLLLTHLLALLTIPLLLAWAF